LFVKYDFFYAQASAWAYFFDNKKEGVCVMKHVKFLVLGFIFLSGILRGAVPAKTAVPASGVTASGVKEKLIKLYTFIETHNKARSNLFEDQEFLETFKFFQSKEVKNFFLGAKTLPQTVDAAEKVPVIQAIILCCTSLKAGLFWAKCSLDSSRENPLDSLSILSDEYFFLFYRLVSFLSPLNSVTLSGSTLYKEILNKYDLAIYFKLIWINNDFKPAKNWTTISAEYTTPEQRYALFKNLLPKAYELEWPMVAEKIASSSNIVTEVEKRLRTLKVYFYKWSKQKIDPEKDAEAIMTGCSDFFIKKIGETKKAELQALGQKYYRESIGSQVGDDFNIALAAHLKTMQEKAKDPAMTYPASYRLEKLGKTVTWPELLIEALMFAVDDENFNPPAKKSLQAIFTKLDDEDARGRRNASKLQVFFDEKAVPDLSSAQVLKESNIRTLFPYLDDIIELCKFLEIKNLQKRIFLIPGISSHGYNYQVDLQTFEWVKQYYDAIKEDPVKGRLALFDRMLEKEKKLFEEKWASFAESISGGKIVGPALEYINNRTQEMGYWFDGWSAELAEQIAQRKAIFLKEQTKLIQSQMEMIQSASPELKYEGYKEIINKLSSPPEAIEKIAGDVVGDLATYINELKRVSYHRDEKIMSTAATLKKFLNIFQPYFDLCRGEDRAGFGGNYTDIWEAILNVVKAEQCSLMTRDYDVTDKILVWVSEADAKKFSEAAVKARAGFGLREFKNWLVHGVAGVDFQGLVGPITAFFDVLIMDQSIRDQLVAKINKIEIEYIDSKTARFHLLTAIATKLASKNVLSDGNKKLLQDESTRLYERGDQPLLKTLLILGMFGSDEGTKKIRAWLGRMKDRVELSAKKGAEYFVTLDQALRDLLASKPVVSLAPAPTPEPEPVHAGRPSEDGSKLVSALKKLQEKLKALADQLRA